MIDLPEQLVGVVREAQAMEAHMQHHGEQLPTEAGAYIAHRYIGTQAVLGACRYFGLPAPVTSYEHATIRRYARDSLAPASFFESTAESHNIDLAYQQLGEQAYFSVDGLTYLDEACRDVATNPNPSIANTGLLVENSSLGHSGAAFVHNHRRFPRTGWFAETTGATVGAIAERSYARRLGGAISRAMFERLENFVPGVISNRHQPVAAKNLALEYSVRVVARA